MMLEFWRDFQTLDADHGDRWLDWIHENFNNDSTDPLQGRFALQLVVRWSPKKLVVWGVAPILLSLAIGFAYISSHMTGRTSSPSCRPLGLSPRTSSQPLLVWVESRPALFLTPS